MPKDKRSFFERLTGVVRVDNDSDDELEEKDDTEISDSDESWTDKETEQEGELTVDVYQTADAVVIKSM